jgi:hypothetical protein
MKNLRTTSFMVVLTLCAATVLAQNTFAVKPLLFSKYPDVIDCTPAQLNSFFEGEQGQNVKVSFNNTLTLSGSIKSNLVKYSNLQTVVIKLPAFNNILFTLSKRTDNREIITYVGHLFDNAYADGYELKKSGNGNYQFVKISMAKILPDCSQ